MDEKGNSSFMFHLSSSSSRFLIRFSDIGDYSMADKVDLPGKKNPYAYGDLIQKEMEKQILGDGQVRNIQDFVDHMTEVVKTQSELLKKANWKKMKPDVIAKALSYNVKSLDEMYRMAEFSRGNPDSRTEVISLDMILDQLTEDQLEQLQMWIEENKKAKEP